MKYPGRVPPNAMPFVLPRARSMKYQRPPQPPGAQLTPEVEVVEIHRAIQSARSKHARGLKGVSMPTWVHRLCASWIQEARDEDLWARQGPGPFPDIDEREQLAHVLVEELLESFDFAVQTATSGDDYEVRALRQANGTVVLQLVPGDLATVLLNRPELNALLAALDGLEHDHQDPRTPTLLRAMLQLQQSWQTYYQNHVER